MLISALFLSHYFSNPVKNLFIGEVNYILIVFTVTVLYENKKFILRLAAVEKQRLLKVLENKEPESFKLSKSVGTDLEQRAFADKKIGNEYAPSLDVAISTNPVSYVDFAGDALNTECESKVSI